MINVKYILIHKSIQIKFFIFPSYHDIIYIIQLLIMHLFQVAFYFAGTFYALLIDQTILLPFALVVLLYLVLSKLRVGKQLSIRKKIMVATWTPPSQGNIIVKLQVRTQKVKKAAEKEKGVKLTLTHFAIKAIGQLLVAQPQLNGILTLGKFVPYQTVDVSCLVDIQGGKDLAMITIKGVDKMSIQDIASFIQEKAKGMKKSSGGQQHKKRTGPFKLLPAFLIGVATQVVAFITCKLGISLKALNLQKYPFGAACVTSLGMLGFQDAVAPFTGFSHCTLLAAVCGAHKAPVVEGDQIVVGEVMNTNIVADHRYVDGGKCTTLVPAFKRVFEEPQSFMAGGSRIVKA